MEKRLMADVLWEAANVHLKLDGVSFMSGSCFAVLDSYFGRDKNGKNYGSIRQFLNSLGLEMNGGFDNFPKGPKRQGVRYMWLLLAMHVAEDEGLTV